MKAASAAQGSHLCWSCSLKRQQLFTPHRQPRRSLSYGLRPAGGLQTQQYAVRGPQQERQHQRPTRAERRDLHTTKQARQITHSHAFSATDLTHVSLSELASHREQWQKKDSTKTKPSWIRDELRKWDDEHGHELIPEVVELEADSNEGEATNTYTRLGDEGGHRNPEEEAQDQKDDFVHLSQSRIEEMDDLDPQHRFLRKGDLCELEFPRSERDSIIAVFIRNIGNGSQGQFLSSQGKWVHVPARQVQYAIPGYMEPKLIDKIIPYLPNEEVTPELLEKAAFVDLSVPREISSPIVSRLLEFARESDEVYRTHASRLDNAHALLAHKTDLKFGSLEQVAEKLIGDWSGSKKLPLPALFTVRKALSHAGFGFGSDRRSHRLTGFLQIRSKDQVDMVERVRQWIREWQDALAKNTAHPQRAPNFSTDALNVSHFVEKAQRLIAKSRRNRDATRFGSVGPSHIRRPFSEFDEAMRIVHDEEFSDSDRELVKFMEGWACSNMFLGLRTLESLPPLILQATGMYDEFSLDQPTGFMFLQEIGVLLPHENRVRYDQHLLLPSSQHSRPLEKLMTRLVVPQKPDYFNDSMADLRHDWGSLPVFCVDGEGAHEIDDGLSVEEAGDGEYWVHAHIANPTAFFKPDSDMAKMARHMTETIYMPERAYMMLPRWATSQNFSLGKDRPCLTFSARLNQEGEYLEHKIRPGIIRNVVRMTPDEVDKAIGIGHDMVREVTLSVGGPVPLPGKSKKPVAERLSGLHVEALKTMQKLAEKRQAVRRSAGGVFLSSNEPNIQVWSNNKRAGLGWDHPSRQAARFIEGDPVIQFKTRELVNWFGTGEGVSNILVREMMLLTCEIAAKWCAERNIPIIYRGSMSRIESIDPETYSREILQPAIEKNGGEAPMHLAMEYLKTTGATTLTTQPLRHKVVGLDHYTKATSPLRRYGDMLVHWQIEAALREEANGTSLVGAKNHKFLPMQLDDWKRVMVGMQPRELMIRHAMRYAEEFWISQVFFRAFHYGECELPKTLTAYVYSSGTTSSPGVPIMIKEYSCPGTMLIPEGLTGGDVRAGDWWEVQIVEVQAFHRKILLQPLRLVSRWED